MTDLISRADALRALSNECYHSQADYRNVCIVLKGLPSADAVSREDYHNLLTASNDIDRALREYQAKEEQTSAEAVNREIIKDILKIIPTAYLLEALGFATFEELMESAEAVQGWIPCSERLPETEEEVLVSFYWVGGVSGTVYKEMALSRHSHRGWEDMNDGIDTVEAWMPLPKPYKGGVVGIIPSLIADRR